MTSDGKCPRKPEKLANHQNGNGSGKGGKESVAFKRKVARVMREFHAGILKSSSGRRVTSEKQALAIALSEARRYAS